jgi:hypothetical protein
MDRVFQIDKSNLDNYKVEPDDITKDQFNSSVRIFVSSLVLNFHKKCHTFFFKMHDSVPVTRLDLSDVYVWCKNSTVSERVGHLSNGGTPSMKTVVMSTMFLNTVLVAQPLCSDGDVRRGCRVLVSSSSDEKTVQIVAKRGRNVRGEVIVGVSIFTPNICIECKRGPKDVKLKACKRCFEHDRIRVLYCGKECQNSDYIRHKNVCKADWNDEDWKDWDVMPAKHVRMSGASVESVNTDDEEQIA